MQKLHVKTFINASPEKVWDTMLSRETYREWTKAFNPTSDFTGEVKGDWSEGSKMLFIGSDPKTGEQGGMVSKIAESHKPEFLSIKHVGIIVNGKEMMEGPEVEKWAPAFENYTFTEKDGGTELIVDMDIAESEKEAMEGMWKKGLEDLKKLCEK